MANQTYTFGTLATFDEANGSGPVGNVIIDSAGNLYGTTSKGGANGDGTVFEIANGSNSVTTLATFDGANGASPQDSLVMDAAGNLYGTTDNGGATNDAGTVFEIAKGSNSVTTLVTFNNSNGGNPAGSLIIDSAGNLFGTSQFGGDQGGEVFEVANGSDSATALATFNVTNGSDPLGSLIADSAGNLYGTTALGGGASGDGEVFEILNGSHSVKILATFDGTNGAEPDGAVVMDSDGNLYGTTQFDSTIINSDGSFDGSGAGEVFKIASGSDSVTVLAKFDGTNGANPQGSLIMDSAGNLFGTTTAGGADNDGTVFEIPNGTDSVATLATFDGTNGAFSASSVIADGSGNLYGTTFEGGASGNGTVFKLIPQTAPVIVSEAASPTSADLNSGTVTFTLATSEVVNAAGSSLTLNNGATATYASGDGLTTPLTYAYTVAPGHDTTDLQATALNGSISDGAGNGLNTTTFTVIDTMDVIDTILPATPVAVDPTTSGFVNGRTPVMTGTVADASGGTSVELFEGDPSNGGQDLGAATVNGDGTWTFTQNIGAGDFNALTAVATDASGTTTVASAPYELVTGITGEPYRAVEYDAASDGSYSYTQYGRNGVLLVAAYDNGDNTHTIEGNGDAGNQLNSVGNDMMTGGGANTTFVFFPGFGQDEVTDFAVGGQGHDTIDVSNTHYSSLTEMLNHTTMSHGSAIFQLNGRDSITFDGVTKAELSNHPKDFAFA